MLRLVMLLFVLMLFRGVDMEESRELAKIPRGVSRVSYLHEHLSNRRERKFLEANNQRNQKAYLPSQDVLNSPVATFVEIVRQLCPLVGHGLSGAAKFPRFSLTWGNDNDKAWRRTVDFVFLEELSSMTQ
jgi:hypothetical protein